MPRIGITAYDLLVSCPGDVTDYVDIIRECVDNFNRTIGVANNSEIVVKHWSTDSYPESGDKPQELLNKQFVRDCDAAVALFWTKFGTKTDKYGSGTEEEIEEMLSSGKQVFMYFLDAPANPSTINMEQYKKVQEFKEKYTSRGIYSVIKEKNDFKTQFTNHLTMHFLPLVSGEKMHFEKKFSPRIIIQSEDLEDIPQAIVKTSHFTECKLLNQKRESCIEKLKSLQNNYLPSRNKNGNTLTENNHLNKTDHAKLMNMSDFILSELQDADISDEIKNVILDFATENNIIVEPIFWNVGNLRKGLLPIPAQFGGGTSFDGKEEEKQRYKSIEDLYLDIEEYLEYKEFFSSIDKQYFVSLVVSNFGNTFDEDIDVKLIIDRGLLIQPKNIVIPDINIIEDILEMNFIEFVYKIKNNDTINPYPDYPTDPDYSPVMPELGYNILGRSAREEYEEQKEQYEDDLNRVFCYQYFNKADSDIMSFHINYLKHNTTVTFPSVLIFKDIPKEIEYEITSKHSPDVIKGKIKIINKD